MSPRSIIAGGLCVALVAGCIALLFSSPALAGVGAAFALAGALAARLFINAGRSHSLSPSVSASLSNKQVSSVAVQSAKLTARATAIAESVPAGELLEATMDSMREGMLVVDGEMRVVASNAAARSLLGLNEGANKLPRLGDLTRNPAILSAFLGALERGERIETKVETMEADRRVFDLRVAPLQQRGGAMTAGGAITVTTTAMPTGARGAVGVFFDITRLERLERVRQEFLSNVSHELRTPLTAIRTFVETLEDGAIDDAAHNRRFLSIIARNAARMHSLIDDILELSAIEAGKVTVEVRPVRLRAQVNEVMTALSASAGERGVTLHNEIAEDVFVYADARRLEQMLTNLADNAVKFNTEGGTVHIGHELAGGRDRITVTDSGEGIAPEHIHRIFERFYRIDRARSRALGGTGLGLAIVKHLARAHGGEATVRSTHGAGSTFTIELPHSGNLESQSGQHE